MKNQTRNTESESEREKIKGLKDENETLNKKMSNLMEVMEEMAMVITSMLRQITNNDSDTGE